MWLKMRRLMCMVEDGMAHVVEDAAAHVQLPIVHG